MKRLGGTTQSLYIYSEWRRSNCYTLYMHDIKDRLSSDLKIAMAQKDMVSIRAIRILRARIDNAEAVFVPERPMQVSGPIAGVSDQTEVPRKILSMEDVAQLIKDEITETEKALGILEAYSLPDTEDLAARIAIFKKYL